jgi:cell division septation protein DedD
MSSIPVVSRIAGSVTVRTQTGAPHDVLSVEPVNDTELVITGESSLAAVSLAGAGTVRVGPSSSTTVALTNGQLFIIPTTALLCAQTESNLITIRSNGSDVTPASAATFDIAADGQGELVVAVFTGSVTLASRTTSWRTAAGHATVVAADGSVHDAALPDVIARFTSLKCPDADVVAAAMPSPAHASSGGGGGGGWILGILALVAGAAALTSSHGGGGSGGPGPTANPTGNPTSVPTGTPTPTPTPISVSTPTPTPAPTPTPTPMPTPTPTPMPTPTPTPTPDPTRTPHPHPSHTPHAAFVPR